MRRRLPLSTHQEEAIFHKLILAAVLAATLVPAATAPLAAQETSKTPNRELNGTDGAQQVESKDKLGRYEIQHIMQS